MFYVRPNYRYPKTSYVFFSLCVVGGGGGGGRGRWNEAENSHFIIYYFLYRFHQNYNV